MSNSTNDPTAPDYGASQPPPLPDPPGGQGGPASPIPPYEGAPPSSPYEPPAPQQPPPHQPPLGQPTDGQPDFGQPPYGQTPYGQPQYGQNPDGSGPQDRPGYGAFPAVGDNVWQQPQYGQVPQWQADYGQGGFGQQMVTAPRMPRLGSYLIDWLIVSIPSWVLLTIFGGLANNQAPSEFPGIYAPIAVMVYVVLPMLSYAYYGYFGGIKGATIGQRAVGLKVVGDRTGEPIGFWWYVLRMLVLSITGSICFLGYLSIFFDSSGKDRGWHDLAGRSRVVKDR